MYQQNEHEIVRVAQQWMASIREGKRNGKQYLGPNGAFSSENASRILDYSVKNYRVVTFESLDKALDLLARSNRLEGFEQSVGSGDISTPGPSRGSLSLESNGSVQDLIAKILNKRVAADSASDAAQAARHAGWTPLRDDATEEEKKRADPRALRAWIVRQRGLDRARLD